MSRENINTEAIEYDKNQKDAILGALEIIKNVCNEQFDCETCPFYSPKEIECCITAHRPRNWVAYKETNCWRALS